MNTENTIDRFRGNYYYLSNFYDVDLVYDGLRYSNSESAFQAQKTLDNDFKIKFSFRSGKSAKSLGKSVKLREDWELVKDNIMYEVCLQKFLQNKDILDKLLSTGDAELIEGNLHGDRYWGVCKGTGQNKLGKILMRIRDELRSNNYDLDCVHQDK